MQIENDAQCLQNAQPVLRRGLIDLGVVCNALIVHHLRRSGSHCSDEIQELEGINRARQSLYITLQICRDIARIENMLLLIFFADERRHSAQEDPLKDITRRGHRDCPLTFGQHRHIQAELPKRVSLYLLLRKR